MRPAEGTCGGLLGKEMTLPQRKKQLRAWLERSSEANLSVTLQYPERLLVRDRTAAWTDEWRDDAELTPEDLKPATLFDRPDLLIKPPKPGTDIETLRTRPPSPTPRGMEHVVVPHANPQGIWYGPTQDWYPRKDQEMTGCGPVSASLVTAYASVKPGLENLFTGSEELDVFSTDRKITTRAQFLEHMQALWEYVTPTQMGTWKLPMYEGGIQRFAQSRGIELETESIWVRPAYPAPVPRPSSIRSATSSWTDSHGICLWPS